MKWKPDMGDLVKFTEGPYKDRFATATSDVYTHRHMDAQDYEMEAHGMGQYAGSYGSAFNIVFTDTGDCRRIIYGKHRFEVLHNSREKVEAR